MLKFLPDELELFHNIPHFYKAKQKRHTGASNGYLRKYPAKSFKSPTRRTPRTKRCLATEHTTKAKFRYIHFYISQLDHGDPPFVILFKTATASVPVSIPVGMLIQIMTGSQYTIMIEDQMMMIARICPTLWKVADATLNPIALNGVNFFNMMTVRLLNATPLSDSQNPVPKIIPRNNDAINTLPKLIDNISRQPNIYRAISPSMFANPSFTPGIGSGNDGSNI